MLKENKCKKKRGFGKRNLLILVILAIACLSCILLIKSVINSYINMNKQNSITEPEISELLNNSESSIDEIDTQDTETPFAVLEIPGIKLTTPLYSINSKCNTVDKNVEVMKESAMPDIKYGNLILSGHSGTGKKALFKNLHKLKKGDTVYIHYSSKKYKYTIKDIYEVEKTGIAEIVTNNESTSLTLVTCTKDNDKTQTIYIAEQE